MNRDHFDMVLFVNYLIDALFFNFNGISNTQKLRQERHMNVRCTNI